MTATSFLFSDAKRASFGDDITFTVEEELAAYRAMLLIRRFEEKMGQLVALGAIRGPCKLSIGQEGPIVGLAMAREPQDHVITADLGHGHMLSLGIESRRIAAELLGREEALCGGDEGCGPLTVKERRFMGLYPTAQAAATAGCGLALASRYLANPSACLCFVGRDARKSRMVARAFAMAAKWNLPIVFVTETASSKPTGPVAAAPFVDGADPIIEELVDGTDVRKVRNAGRLALDRARAGEGPCILNMLAHPYRGHDASAQTQRMAREVRREDIDAIAKLRCRILDNRDASELDLRSIEGEVREIVNAAAAAARSSLCSGTRGANISGGPR